MTDTTMAELEAEQIRRAKESGRARQLSSSSLT
jgi:hypothetical protein